MISLTSEGLRNLPKAYGGHVREPGPVTGVATGVYQGGRSLLFGFVDAITDVATEPMRGYRREGSVGIAKGVGRAAAALVTKPAAGAIGLVEHSLRGIHEEINKHRQTDLKLRLNARLEEGRHAAAELTDDDRDRIVKAWMAALPRRKQRKHEHRARLDPRANASRLARFFAVEDLASSGK